MFLTHYMNFSSILGFLQIFNHFWNLDLLLLQISHCFWPYCLVIIRKRTMPFKSTVWTAHPPLFMDLCTLEIPFPPSVFLFISYPHLHALFFVRFRHFLRGKHCIILLFHYSSWLLCFLVSTKNPYVSTTCILRLSFVQIIFHLWRYILSDSTIWGLKFSLIPSRFNTKFLESLKIMKRNCYLLQESECFHNEKAIAPTLRERRIFFLLHREPHRRLLEMRSKLAKQPPTPRRLRHRIWPVRSRRQERRVLHSDRRLRWRSGQSKARNITIRRDTAATSLDRLPRQHAHQTLTGAHLQQLQNPRRPRRQRPHRRRRLHHLAVHKQRHHPQHPHPPLLSIR